MRYLTNISAAIRILGARSGLSTPSLCGTKNILCKDKKGDCKTNALQSFFMASCRTSEDPQIGEMPTIDNINTESVIDNEENADLQSTSNEVLQTGENDDIIEIRGDSDEFDNRGRALESVEEIRRRFFTQSGHEEDKRSIRESYEAFSERTSNTDERSGEKTKRIVRIGKTALAFTPSEADTPLRRFVEELNKIGIEAYCCEGDIESNLNLTAK